ncbi:3-oxoacyl-[acyl-carrier-protein] synthase, KASIII [hydrothermal vent metagenome]|uniref:beta-ketoacyl-[acyl-carrier-protein] synthase III n=1 Tax=hydrothermal vent metagenome TaxID=652676 RepID=A0A3B1D503_9ZZZZ
MNNIGIIGLGHYLPKRILSNTELEKLVDTTDEWIFTRTGIKERRLAQKNEKNSDLAIKAATEALKNSKIDPEKLDLIIVATISPDSNFPSVACLVQKALNAKNAAAFDISAACSGFLYGITTAKQFLTTGFYKNALVIASEKFTHLLDWTERTTCVLFGDGAGACVLAPVKGDRGIVADYLHAQGQYGNLLSVIGKGREPLDQKTQTIILPQLVMHGKELFKVAVNSMADAVTVALKKAKLKLKDIDCVVPHQANDRIITGVAKKLGVPKEKIFINIEKYGNMSAASIAVALYEAVEEKRIKKGSIVVLVAFGAGLVSAANIVKW